jgi:hypothetical protein
MHRTRWSHGLIARAMSFALACAFAAPWWTTAGAQARPAVGRREIVGVVRDPLGGPLAGVTVAIPGSTVVTNARGMFQLFTAEIDTVTISIRYVGYTAVSALLTAREKQWDTVLVQLDRAAQALEGVNVRETPTRRALGLRDFEERRAKGNGLFVTRADIAARGVSRMSDVVRNMRGVNIVRGRVRFVSQTGSRGTVCQPDIWLDGSRAQGMEVDDILASDVEAMELYSSFSTVPFEFTPRGSNTLPCGSIVIWTRVPNGKTP